MSSRKTINDVGQRVKSFNGTASGALANLAAQGIPFLLLIVVTPILLHALGRERYGALVLFNLVPQIAGQLDLGLSTAATRGFAQYSAHADRAAAMRLYREVLALLTMWGLALGAAFYCFHPAIAHALKLDDAVDDGSLAYLATALTIPLALANGATLVPLRALERYGRAAQVQVIAGIAFWSSCTVWAAHGATLAQLVALGTVSVAATTFALFLIAGVTPVAPDARRQAADALAGSKAGQTAGTTTAVDGLPKVPSSRLLIAPFLPVSASAFVAQVSSLATFHADKLIVSALVSPAAAGAYAICTSLANKTLLVIASAATFTFPRATHLHAAGDARGLLAVYCTTARICATLTMTALVPIVGFAHCFLTLWLGASFAGDYSVVLRLLAIGYALTATSVVSANVTMGIGKARIAATSAMIGGVLTIGGLLLLTPGFGIAGAAAASLIGMSQTVVFNALVSSRLGPEAADTSWPLLARLALVGTPVALVIAAFAPLIHDWWTFALWSLVATCAFPVAWCCSFGRDREWSMIRGLAASIRG